MLQEIKQVKPLSIYVYLSLIIALVLTGIGVSLYLCQSHYKVYTDMAYASFCAISKAVNCDTVSQSPYSIFWDIPVPVWGLVGYLFMLAIVIIAFDMQNKTLNMYPLLMVLGLIFSLISILLGIISAKIIHSYCLMCIITYGINFLLFFMIWFTRRRFEKCSWRISFQRNFSFLKAIKAKALIVLTAFLIVILTIWVFLPRYWQFQLDAHDSGSGQIQTGIADDGSPWIGAKHPILTIVEYTDYMCFQCKKMHHFLRGLVNAYPDKLKLVHKHFPMDRKANPMLKESLHPGSGILASIAIHAVKEKKFWEINDYLYQYDLGKGAIFFKKIAQQTGLSLESLKQGVYGKDVKAKLTMDILSGLKENITGTPTYIVNGKVYTGNIPPDVLKVLYK